MNSNQMSNYDFTVGSVSGSATREEDHRFLIRSLTRLVEPPIPPMAAKF